MNMRTLSVAILMAMGCYSHQTHAQSYDVPINGGRGVIIRANRDNSNHYEPISFQVGQNGNLDHYKLQLTKTAAHFSVPVYLQQPLHLNNNAALTAHNATFGGVARFNGNLLGNRIGLGIDAPLEKLHVKNANIRLDNGQYQSWGPMILHADVDNSGDDIFSFRNSTDQEMANLTDGTMTLSFNSTLQASGMLKLRAGSSDTANDIVSFRNGANEEMARLHDGVLSLNQVRLNVTTFPDYVFAKEYELMPIQDVATYIEKNKRLPNMPSEAEVVKEGMNVGEVNIKLVEKVEELTLYIIQLQKQLDQQQKAIESLKKTSNK